ncbi:Palmitoyltransferase [Sorochytrium milnesiophthora]
MNWHALFVVVTVFLITFIPIASQLVVFRPLYREQPSSALAALLVVFDASVVLLWISYYKACTTDPGTVPKDWVPPEDANAVVEMKKSTNKPRYCRTCICYKPPRSHHCSTCGRCVLKMDHHCPWINNCVGHRNHGHFIRFLFYVDIATTICVSLLTYRMYKWLHLPPHYTVVPADKCLWAPKIMNAEVTRQMMYALSNLVLGGLVWLCVGGLSIYHFYYLFTNLTTIESLEKERSANLLKEGQVGHVRNPYNISRMHNICQVLGLQPWRWCLPHAMHGDGLSFKVKQTDWEYSVVPTTEATSSPYYHPDQSYQRYGRHVRQGSEGLEVSMDPYASYRAMAPENAHGQEELGESGSATDGDESNDDVPLAQLQQHRRPVPRNNLKIAKQD